MYIILQKTTIMTYHKRHILLISINFGIFFPMCKSSFCSKNGHFAVCSSFYEINAFFTA
jgi:hypothetical protein